MKLFLILTLTALCFGQSKDEWVIQQYDKILDSLSQALQATPSDNVSNLSAIHNDIARFKALRQTAIEQSRKSKQDEMFKPDKFNEITDNLEKEIAELEQSKIDNTNNTELSFSEKFEKESRIIQRIAELQEEIKQTKTMKIIAEKSALPYNGGIMRAGHKIKTSVTLSVIGIILGAVAVPVASKSYKVSIGLGIGGLVFNIISIGQLWSAGDELENTTGIGRAE